MNNTKKVYYKVTYLLDDDAAEASGYGRYIRYFKGDTLGACIAQSILESEFFELILHHKEITRGEYRRGRRKEAYKPRQGNAKQNEADWERQLASARKYVTWRAPF